MVEKMSDQDVWRLKRGGHDYRKVYAAYKSAMEHTGQPTVILAQTIKGYGLGPHFAGRNATHQMKKLTPEDLRLLRDSLKIPISDEDLDRDPYQPPYYRPDDNDETLRYLRDRRAKLGGGVPARRVGGTSLKLPEDSAYEVTRRGSGKQQVATTMAFVRLLRDLMRDKDFGPRVVPIIPDEARTFGMDSFFPTAKIYNPHGQQYLSVDADLMLAYKESTVGPDHPRRHQRGRLGRGVHGGRARRTPRTASRWCRSTPSTRCSASSAPPTASGPRRTRWPAAS